jgi:predicted nucleotide-binding protein
MFLFEQAKTLCILPSSAYFLKNKGFSVRHYISEIQSDYSKNKDRATKRLSTLKKLFEERIADAEALPMNPAAQQSPTPNTGKVFIVHGHDHGVKETVARFIDKLDLESIFLHEQPNEGRTII